MLEVELKSVVADLDGARARLVSLGAPLSFVGRLEDRRYDTAQRALAARDHVLRTRVYRGADGSRAELDWKGATAYENGYKLRDEIASGVSDADALANILQQLGFQVTIAIDRTVWQYAVRGATVRLERYPRMDDLVEVEGPPEAIERAIEALGLPRTGFTTERLPDFVRRYQERTGMAAALSDDELTGVARYDPSNA